MRSLSLLALLLTACASVPASRVQVRLVPDEADAVLTILDKRAAHEAIADADWQHLFATEGYVRLQKRERSMKRPFEDADFRTFVLSDDLLAKRAMLRTTLQELDARGSQR